MILNNYLDKEVVDKGSELYMCMHGGGKWEKKRDISKISIDLLM